MSRRRATYVIPDWAKIVGVIGPGLGLISWVGSSVNTGYQFKETLATKSEVADVAKSIRDLIQQNKAETTDLIVKTSKEDREFTRSYSDSNHDKAVAEMNEKIGKLSIDMTEKMSKVSTDIGTQGTKVDMMLRTLQAMRDDAWNEHQMKRRGKE